LECVVTGGGPLGEVRVVKSPDKAYDLENDAIKAAKRWRFTLGSKNEEAVSGSRLA
jgi:hypothetical protein